jgi:hypothetical protein
MKATPTMLLKTHVEKMSVLATPTIFMKTSDLSRRSHDIHENKGSCAPGSTGRKQRMRDPHEKGVANHSGPSERPQRPRGIDGGGRSHPRRGQFPAGGKKIKKCTNEAGMYMKTHESLTLSPEKVGHLCLRFGHLRLTDTDFAENRRFATTICQINSLVFSCIIQPICEL